MANHNQDPGLGDIATIFRAGLGVLQYTHTTPEVKFVGKRRR